MDSIMPTCAILLERFTLITSEELIKIVSVMNKTTCPFDPFPSKLLLSHLPTIIDTIVHIITMVGKGIESYLVLLDLSAAWFTTALKSYFSNRSQPVLIDDVMSGVATLCVGCRSVLF